MTNTARKMTGPTKIIELDDLPVSKWKVDQKALHLWKGKFWKKEDIGCVLCVEKEGNEHITFSHSDNDGKESFLCMEHGPLIEVPYLMQKTYIIRIGDITREGVEELEDTMLFPEEMTIQARNELIGQLLDNAQKEEVESGAAPSDDDDSED